MEVENDLKDTIYQHVSDKIGEITKEETEKAKQRVEERINELVDGLALNIMNQYKIETDTNKIIITVDKSELRNE